MDLFFYGLFAILSAWVLWRGLQALYASVTQHKKLTKAFLDEFDSWWNKEGKDGGANAR